MSPVFPVVNKMRGAGVGWARCSVKERGRRLERLRVLMAENADELAQCVSEEIGKPLQEAYGADVLSTMKALGWVVKNAPKVLKERGIAGKRGAYRQAMPLGVVGVIGTWNYPVFLDTAAIAWALAAGNSVVWKPSELAENTAKFVYALMRQAELPVELVCGSGAVGRELCHAGCDKIAFTGGVTTGRKILAELAQHGTPSVMELSGNDAMIVLADADVEAAAKSAVWGRVCNAGQSCVAPQRVYVDESIYEEFLTVCKREMEALRFGVDYGSLRTSALCERAQKLVCEAREFGGRVLVGGCPVSETGGRGFQATLLADCAEHLLIIREDFFAPVLTVNSFSDVQDAIRKVNESEMGLGASIWTRNIRQVRELAALLHVGVVSINAVLMDAADPALPFGGRGASGFGKQRGAAGLEEFVVWKTVALHKSGGTRRHLFPYRPQTLPILRGIIALQAAKGLGAKFRAMRELGQEAMNWNKDAPNESDKEIMERGIDG